ncbi:hypothetical protein [Saccharothrix syringae]|nr:hypothetical protein [Saccharothrix syringae]
MHAREPRSSPSAASKATPTTRTRGADLGDCMADKTDGLDR